MRWPAKRRLPHLDFDYQRQPSQLGAAGWILWIAATVFASDVAWSYVQTRETLDKRMQTLRAMASKPRPEAEARTYQPKDVEREVAFARMAIYRIAMPWSELFKALSATAVEDVALLSIEPDANSGVLQITAEAKDIPTMLTYVARLEANNYFPTVALARHEIKRAEPRRPVSFVVVATWKNKS
jgi:hypothetical protein